MQISHSAALVANGNLCHQEHQSNHDRSSRHRSLFVLFDLRILLSLFSAPVLLKLLPCCADAITFSHQEHYITSLIFSLSALVSHYFEKGGTNRICNNILLFHTSIKQHMRKMPATGCIKVMQFLQDFDENNDLQLGQEIGTVECCQYSYFPSLLLMAMIGSNR